MFGFPWIHAPEKSILYHDVSPLSVTKNGCKFFFLLWNYSCVMLDRKLPKSLYCVLEGIQMEIVVECLYLCWKRWNGGWLL